MRGDLLHGCLLSPFGSKARPRTARGRVDELCCDLLMEMKRWFFWSSLNGGAIYEGVDRVHRQIAGG